MKIRWRLRMAAAQREVWTGTELRRLLAEKAGLELSSASVSALFTKEPSQVKMITLAALCTALQCTPNDLIEVDTTPVERPAALPRPATEGRLRSGPVDASDVTKQRRDGQEATRLRDLWCSGRISRPATLLSVLAPAYRAGREVDMSIVRA